MRKALCLVVLLTACAVDPEADPAPDSFTVTAVELGPDGGAKLLSRTKVTGAQRDALGPGQRAQSSGPAGQKTSALDEIEIDLPCGPVAVFLYDRANYGGDVLCIRGTGSMHLSQFIHHFEAQHDFFGTHIVPVGWQGLAASAWASYVSADFFQDGSSDPVVSLGPATGTNFFHIAHGFLFRYPPDSLTIY